MKMTKYEQDGEEKQSYPQACMLNKLNFRAKQTLKWQIQREVNYTVSKQACMLNKL